MLVAADVDCAAGNHALAWLGNAAIKPLNRVLRGNADFTTSFNSFIMNIHLIFPENLASKLSWSTSFCFHCCAKNSQHADTNFGSACTTHSKLRVHEPRRLFACLGLKLLCRNQLGMTMSTFSSSLPALSVLLSMLTK